MQAAWRAAQAGLSRIARDHISGSAELALRAAQMLETFLRRSRPLAEAQLAGALARLARALLSAQPSMAPVLNLANTVLLATESGAPRLRERVRSDLARFRAALEELPQVIARRFVRLVPHSATVLTYSYSSTVLQALLGAQRAGEKLRVVCSEGRPMFEGRRLASGLARAGVPVMLVVDAMLPLLVAEADLIVCGADAITRKGFVNKVGTSALLAAARGAGVPFYVLADRTKLLPRGLERWHTVREETASEVWAGRPRRVRVLNRYFELVGWPLGGGTLRILTDTGMITPRRLMRRLARLPVAKRLRSG